MANGNEGDDANNGAVRFDVDENQRKNTEEAFFEVTADRDVTKLGFTYSGGRNIVNSVRNGSWAQKNDIRENDVMLEVNGEDFTRENLTPAEKHQIMKNRRPLRIRFVRNRVFEKGSYFGRHKSMYMNGDDLAVEDVQPGFEKILEVELPAGVGLRNGGNLADDSTTVGLLLSGNRNII